MAENAGIILEEIKNLRAFYDSLKKENLDLLFFFESEESSDFKKNIEQNIQYAFVCEFAEIENIFSYHEKQKTLRKQMLAFLCECLCQLHVFSVFMNKTMAKLQQLIRVDDFQFLSLSQKIFSFSSLFYKNEPKTPRFVCLLNEIKIGIQNLFDQLAKSFFFPVNTNKNAHSN
jgi:hypothetical protein